MTLWGGYSYLIFFVQQIAGITELQKKGINVTVITNSFAANNQFTVHSARWICTFT